jgi:Protein of unknown function (DUF3800)
VYMIYMDDSRHGKRKQFLTALILKDLDFRAIEGFMGYIVYNHVAEEKRQDFEFHAAELFNGTPPFSDINTETALNIFEDCVSIIEHSKCALLYACVDLENLQSGIHGSSSPVDVAFRMLLPEIERWFVKNAPTELGILICDDTTDTKIKNQLHNSFSGKRHPAVTSADFIDGKFANVKEDRGELHHIHDAMYFGNSAHSRGIQLADVCGYIIKRHLCEQLETEHLYQRLEPAIFARKHEPEKK